MLEAGNFDTNRKGVQFKTCNRCRANAKVLRARPEFKAKQKEYNDRPERKAKQKESTKRYKQLPEVKARRAEKGAVRWTCEKCNIDFRTDYKYLHNKLGCTM